jgi:hypothetical protein
MCYREVSTGCEMASSAISSENFSLAFRAMLSMHTLYGYRYLYKTWYALLQVKLNLAEKISSISVRVRRASHWHERKHN